MNTWRWIWLAWIVFGAVFEVIALVRSKRGDTLSEAIWYWCRVTPGNTFTTWTALHLLAAFFLLWLFVHLMTGYFR